MRDHRPASERLRALPPGDAGARTPSEAGQPEAKRADVSDLALPRHDPHPIVVDALYETRCEVCGWFVMALEPIARDPFGQWTHVSCLRGWLDATLAPPRHRPARMIEMTDAAAETPVPQGLGAVVTVSRDVALDLGLVEPTPEEAAERAAQHEQWQREEAERARRRDAWLADLSPLVGPAGRAVLDLHTRDEAGYCDGCAGFHPEAAAPWPCPTIEAMAAAVGRDIHAA